MKKVTVIFLSSYANQKTGNEMVVSRDMAKMLIGKNVAQEKSVAPQEAEKQEAEKQEAEKQEAEKQEATQQKETKINNNQKQKK